MHQPRYDMVLSTVYRCCQPTGNAFLGPQTDAGAWDEHPVRAGLDLCVRVSAKRLSGNQFVQ